MKKEYATPKMETVNVQVECMLIPASLNSEKVNNMAAPGRFDFEEDLSELFDEKGMPKF